jgi:hypothetical protein
MAVNISAFVDAVNQDEASEVLIPRDPLLSGCDTVEAFLTFPTVNGQPRELSTLTFGWNGRERYVRLIDADNRRSLSAEGSDCRECCEILEAKLQSNPVRWYTWKHTNGKGSKKKRGS